MLARHLIAIIIVLVAAACNAEETPDPRHLAEALRNHPDKRIQNHIRSWSSLVKMRAWSLDNGKRSIEARYLNHDYKQKQVKLLALDGKELLIPMASLSKSDQKIIDAIDRIKPSLLAEVNTKIPADRDSDSELLPSFQDRIDLLAPSHPQRDSLRGRWALEGGKLRSTSANASIVFRTPIQGDYRLSCEFTRTSGNDSLWFTLPIGTTNFQVEFSGYFGKYHGLSYVNGKHAVDGHSAVAYPGAISNNEKHRVEIDASSQGDHARVRVAIDGKHILAFDGLVSQLRADPRWLPSDRRWVALHTAQATAEVSLLTIQYTNKALSQLLSLRRNAVSSEPKREEIFAKIEAERAKTSQLIPDKWKQVAYMLGQEKGDARLSLWKAMGTCDKNFADTTAPPIADMYAKADSDMQTLIEMLCCSVEIMLIWEKHDPSFDIYLPSNQTAEDKEWNRTVYRAILKTLDLFGDVDVFRGLPYQEKAASIKRRWETKVQALTTGK